MDLDSELEAQHFQRYYSIKDLVKGKIVADSDCGDGYGSFMISENAEKVYGIDISEEAVRETSEGYISNNLKFINASIEKLPFEGNSINEFHVNEFY